MYICEGMYNYLNDTRRERERCKNDEDRGDERAGPVKSKVSSNASRQNFRMCKLSSSVYLWTTILEANPFFLMIWQISPGLLAVTVTR